MGDKIDKISDIKDSVFNTVSDTAGWVADAVKGYLGFEKGSPLTKMGAVDVVEYFRWSVNKPSQYYLKEVPRIILTEYQSNTSPAMDDIKYTAALTAAAGKALVGKSSVNDDVSPYVNMYKGDLTGNQFTLPFFTDFNHICTNTWSTPTASDKGMVGAGMDMVQEGIQQASSVLQPGVVEKRMVWGGTTPSSFTFRFNIYNTLTTNDEISKNFKLMRTLVHNNLPDKTSSSTMLPPCYYAIDVPGVRMAPACAISITVTNIGQLNTKLLMVDMADGTSKKVPVVVPDAWGFSISVQELLKETRQIYEGAFDESQKVMVITPNDDKESASVGEEGI